MLATCFSLWCHKIQKVTLWTKERKRDALGSNHPATLRLKLTLTRPPKVCAKQIYVVSRLQWFGLRNKSKRAASTSRRVNYSQPSAPQSHNQTFGERPEDKQTLQFHLPNRSKRGPSNQRMARQHGVDSSYHCVFPTPPITVEEAAYVGSLHECHVSACARSIPSQYVFPMLCVGWDHPLARNSRMQPHRPHGDVRDYMRWMGNAMPLECSNWGFLPRLFTLRIQEVGFEPILVWCIPESWVFTANPQLNSCWLWNQ